MKTEPNDPAFSGLDQVQKDAWNTIPGLTKREYFAAMALQGLLSGAWRDNTPQEIASASVINADALIEALNK